jgi:hypothetical protein
MSTMPAEVDFDLSRLENEWRRVFEASIAARAAYQTLASRRCADVESLDAAREHLDRSEAAKARVLATIDRLRARLPLL